MSAARTSGSRAGPKATPVAGADIMSGDSGAAVAMAALAPLEAGGHLADIDRHFVRFIASVDGRESPEMALAAALVSAHARSGHACVDLKAVAGRAWPEDAIGNGAARLPELKPWIKTLAASPAVAAPGDDEEPRPLILDSANGEPRLYLARFFAAENMVATGLRRLAAAEPEGKGAPTAKQIDAALGRVFPAKDARVARARAAVRTALTRRLCVVSGGPGTGKTTTVAAIVKLLVELEITTPNRIALAAPTGKAAARLQEAVRPQEAVRELRATTVHRLLSRPRTRSDMERPRAALLPYDVLILDEGSMVDIALMARVLAALPDGARLIVLGDASQLASVQPGFVFADVCRAGEETDTSPLAPCVIRLVHNWRFDDAGGIGRLAAAVVEGVPDKALAALADSGDDETSLALLPDRAAFDRLAVRFTDERFAPMVRELRDFHDLDSLNDKERVVSLVPSFRVLCAHRQGMFGTERFNELVHQRLRGLGLTRGANPAFYPGRPIIVTRNDHQRTGLMNGDTGVVVGDAEGRLRVWFPELPGDNGGPMLVAPVRLPPHESFFAVTVHRAQGSEYDEVAVVPGPAGSRVVTRELLYTAITRARRRVVIHGDEAVLRAALERTAERATGLHAALAAAASAPPQRQRRTRSRSGDSGT